MAIQETKLEATLIMNSSIEEVIAFKCCSLPDQNLEIHLRNGGAQPLTVQGFFVLEGDAEPTRIDNLYPPGDLRLPPGEPMAVYCHMDDAEWARSRQITFFDAEGRAYSFPTLSSVRGG